MPVYEYACNACGKTVSIFVRSMSSPVSGVCDRCGSADLRRLMSRFAVVRPSGGGDLDSLDDDALMDGFDQNDPRAMASWMRKMQGEMGDEMGPEFDDMVARLERGESLDEDLGGFDGQHHGDDDGLGGLEEAF